MNYTDHTTRTRTGMRSRKPQLTKPLGWLLCALLLAAIPLTLSYFDASSSRAQDTVVAQTVMHKRLAPGPRAPMPVGNIPGWHQLFSDNFNGNRLNRSKWRLYWGHPGGDRAGWFDPRHVFVKHGLLVISAYRDRRNGGRWASGGVSSSPGLIQTYGKYEVRYPSTGVRGRARRAADARQQLLAARDRLQRGQRQQPRRHARTLHFGAHDTHWSASLKNVNLTQWHTLGVEWTPNKLQWTIDGRVWKTMTGNVIPSSQWCSICSLRPGRARAAGAAVPTQAPHGRSTCTLTGSSLTLLTAARTS